MRKFSYETNCVNSTAKFIDEMVDKSVEVTYETFVKHVDPAELANIFSHYDWGPGNKGGLRLKNDYAVSFYKSKYRGRPCYYVCHSAIEYIFVRR